MTAGSNFHPQFPRSPLVTPGTMIPLLARTQARLTTYFSDLCFKSLASNFFFRGTSSLGTGHYLSPGGGGGVGVGGFGGGSLDF